MSKIKTKFNIVVAGYFSFADLGNSIVKSTVTDPTWSITSIINTGLQGGGYIP